MIYHLATRDSGHILMLSKDLKEFEINKQRFIDVCKYQNFNIEVESSHFPLKLARLVRFFDYSRMLQESFGLPAIDVEGVKSRMEPPLKLTRKDMEVIKGLVGNPEMTDTQICERINVSRPTLAKKREQLEARGVISRVIVPDMVSIGQEFVVVNLLDFIAGSREIHAELLFELYLRAHVLVETDSEGLIISTAQDYGQIKKILQVMDDSKIDRKFKEKFRIIPLAEIVHKSLDFKPLVDKVLV
jgi:hypothetical protein